MFCIPIRVYYEDTDGSGVVYHAGYLRYFERARTEWLRAAGFSQQELREMFGISFTVNHLEIDYLRPARLDDRLLASAEVVACRRASLRFCQILRREGDAAELCRATVSVACVDARTFKPSRLPGALRQRLADASQSPECFRA